MKEEKKPKQPKPKARVTYKTKEDFMRWWREQDARKKERQKKDNE